MTIFRCMLVLAALVFGLQAQSSDSSQSSIKKTLLVYDDCYAKSQPYIEFFRNEFGKTGIAFDELSLKKNGKKVPADYEVILIYSRVVAFNMASPVRTWLKSLKTLFNKKVFVFVTANRWFEKTNMQQIVKLVSDRGGEVVDAVSTATGKMSTEQKKESVAKQVAKIKR